MSDMTIGDITGLLPEDSILEQGDVWFIDMGQNEGHEQNGERPVLIISTNNHNEQSKTPMVCPCTTSKHKGKNRYHVAVGTWENDKTIVTYANGSQIYSMSSKRFKGRRKIGRADKKQLMKVVKIAKKLMWVKK